MAGEGEMSEWFKEHAWKVCIRQKCIRGSNPRLSASTAFAPRTRGEGDVTPDPKGENRCNDSIAVPQVHQFLKASRAYQMSTCENKEETKTSKFFYVYILACNDGQLYTGCTRNLKERFNRHQKGWIPITKDKIPVKLAWCGAFPEQSIAFEFEKYLKSGSGRAFAKKHLLKK